MEKITEIKNIDSISPGILLNNKFLFKPHSFENLA